MVRETCSTVLLVLSMLLGWSASGHATIYYMGAAAPASDGNNGLTSATPWKTFGFALAQLIPGDTLRLLNGHYTFSANGRLVANCATGIRDGTAGQRITIVAVSERQAWLDGDGSTSTVEIRNCDYWTIQGLHVNGRDNPTGTDNAVFFVRDSTNGIFRRNLIHHNNRYQNEMAMAIYGGGSNLIEENEIYTFHRHGLSVSSHAVIRRNYINSRNYVDLAGGYVSSPGNTGDDAVVCYPCESNVYENNILETTQAGIALVTSGTTRNLLLAGNIILDMTGKGMTTNPRGTVPTNVSLVHNVMLRTGTGLLWGNVRDFTCDHCSLFDNTTGVRMYFENEPGAIRPFRGYTTNTLIAGSTGRGVWVTDYDDWHMTNLRVWQNAGGYTPGLTDSHYTGEVNGDPGLGACLVYIPEGSAAATQGVGASVLYQYATPQDSMTPTLTSIPLWDPTSGRFTGCGATVSGVNDSAGISCFDVHRRLNVGVNGCPLPYTNEPPEPPVHEPTTYYIDDAGGSDSDDGLTPATAWATFAHAVATLLPGDTLIVQDGTYAGANMLQASCGTTATSGTADAPITVRAATPRGVWLQSDGTADPIFLDNCAFWTIEDLAATHNDAGSLVSGEGRVVNIKYGDHLTLRGLLVARPKRTGTGSVAMDAIRTYGTNFVTIEDTEIYGFPRRGLYMRGGANESTQGHVVRRVYVHSQDRADGDVVTDDPTRGDIGVQCLSCVNSLFENVVVEDVVQGIRFDVEHPATTNRLLGSIVRGSATGVAVISGAAGGETGVNQMVRDLTISNVSVSGATVAGLHLESVKNVTCTQCSILDGTGVGVLVDESLTAIGDNAPTFTLASPLIAGMTGRGYDVDTTQYTTWAITNPWLYANAGGYTPAVSHANITGETLTDPYRQTCLVWVPQSSPAWQSGPNQTNIGAQIIHQWQGGTETTTLLWDPITHQFPCGAEVAGINGAGDGERCMTVHERLNVETNGCTLAGEVEPPSPPMTYQRRQWRTLPTLAMPW